MDTLSLTKEARIYDGEKTISLKAVLGKLVNYVYKKETRPLSNIIHKTNSEWIKDLNVTPEPIKF